MYVKMTEEEDNKIAERWQKDADGILIFVCPPITLYTAVQLSLTSLNIIDWSVLCCSRRIDYGIHTGPQAKLPGHFRILSCEHLSASRRSQRISLIDPCHSN
jgi:hypothetical protein